MPLQHSALRLGAFCASLLFLSGCVHQVVREVASPITPFAYQKTSSLCKVSPIVTTLGGNMSVSMTVGSDDDHCTVTVSKGGGGSYVSFGVNPAPEYGKVFLYNYNDHTYVNYTPVSAYKGTDQFGVVLIPAKGQVRDQLMVNVTIEAIGVTGVTTAVPKTTVTSTIKKNPEKKSSVHSINRHVVVRHSRHIRLR